MPTAPTSPGLPADPAPAGPSLARDGGRAVLGAVVSNASNVLVILVLARYLGGEAVGHYTIAFAVRAILLLVCGLGMRIAMTRFVAVCVARGEPDTLRGAVRAGVLVPLALATVVAAGWYAMAGPIARDVFGSAELQTPLELFALSLPFFVFTDNALAATQGFQSLRAYVWVGQVLEPATRLGLTMLVLVLGLGVDAASAALLAASVVSAVAAAVALWRALAAVPGSGAVVPWRELAVFAALSWVASMATQGLLWADVVILGVLASAEEVGAYQVAARVVLIGMFVITPLTAAMSPRVAYLWARDDRSGVTDRYAEVVRWTTRLSVPVLAGVVAVPSEVLEVFGPGFSGAVTVVLVLSAGAIAEAVGAPSSVLLNQTGHNRLNMALNVSALVLNVGLNLALIPRWGIEGAAVAWASTLVLGAVVRTIAVRQVAVSRWPIDRPVLAALGGGLLAAAAAALAARTVPDVAVVRLLVAGVVVVVVYLVVVVLAGLSRPEHERVSREVTLVLPGLRRWSVQRRLRGAESGAQDLAIDELVSPFRVDVLARLEMFTLARAHADLRRADPEAFVALLRESRYGAWFDEVLVRRGHVRGEAASTGAREFRQIVSAGTQLLDRYDRLGGASLGRVAVTRVPAGTEIGGWSLAQDRWVLLDGGHRVALAMLDGRRSLSPDDYVVVDDTPPNNTVAFLAGGRLTPQETLDFLARGVAVGAAPTTWAGLLDALDEPADRPHLERWAEARDVAERAEPVSPS